MNVAQVIVLTCAIGTGMIGIGVLDLDQRVRELEKVRGEASVSPETSVCTPRAEPDHGVTIHRHR